MLRENEKNLLSSVDGEELEKYLREITAFNRLSGSEGERKAVEYLAQELDEAGISFHLHDYPARLSDPQGAELKVSSAGDDLNIRAKTWSFCGSTDGEPVRGEMSYIPEDAVPANPLGWFACRHLEEKDLSGRIVVGHFSNPISIFSLQERGAAGYVLCWRDGDEELIHEGNVNMIWGTPLPEESALYPRIPVVVINRADGNDLIDRIHSESLSAEIVTRIDDHVGTLPILEATIAPGSGNREFLLVGNHLDSWHYGATDNGTGNAIALCMAKRLKERADELSYGVRIAWWSGHSNGRYAGSSAYARDHFAELSDSCLAYMNIDMPGLRGAEDYSLVTAGPELYDLAAKTVLDVTGQRGKPAGLVRGWDQSFQNVGISPYFIWASTLPEGHPDRTNDSFMSWWWHTEDDFVRYCDPEVLMRDARLYLLGASRLLGREELILDVKGLFQSIISRLEQLEPTLRNIVEISDCIEALRATMMRYLLVEADLPLSRKLHVLRKLNQIYYSQRGAHLQDWAIPEEYLPGISMVTVLADWKGDERGRLCLHDYGRSQRNRILSLVRDMDFAID